MKFKYNMKEKQAEVDLDVEKVVEKGLEYNDKNWKEKHELKHKSKKELMEIKHKHKMELEEKKQKKTGFFKVLQEAKQKKRELELEEKRRQEEKEQQIFKIKIGATIVLSIVGLSLIILGLVLSTTTNNTSWEMLSCIGMLFLISIPYIWLAKIKRK